MNHLWGARYHLQYCNSKLLSGSYNHLIRTRPLLTKSLTSGSMAALGSLLSQVSSHQSPTAGPPAGTNPDQLLYAWYWLTSLPCTIQALQEPKTSTENIPKRSYFYNTYIIRQEKSQYLTELHLWKIITFSFHHILHAQVSRHAFTIEDWVYVLLTGCFSSPSTVCTVE